ncbi:hypothetical protein EV363DRAFT_1173053, partial [Boletus edulis]
PTLWVLLPPFSSSRTCLGCVYRADTIVFGMVQIRTRHDCIPWMDNLMEHVEDNVAPPRPAPIRWRLNIGYFLDKHLSPSKIDSHCDKPTHQ